MIEIVVPGAHTRVEDRGRHGRAHLGYSLGGAADMRALALANASVGNDLGAPALELTLTGPTVVAAVDVTCAWCGGAWDVLVDDAPAPPCVAVRVRRGQALRAIAGKTGVRAVLAFAGGIATPTTGTVIRSGARLSIGPVLRSPRQGVDALYAAHAGLAQPQLVRVTGGAQATWFGDDARRAFFGEEFTVSADSSRRGVRLLGPRVERADAREPISEGVTAGTIQVTHAGDPIVLHVDQTTTGGYAKIANVIGADLWKVGQLRPGSRVRFERVSLEDAREALFSWHTQLHSLL